MASTKPLRAGTMRSRPLRVSVKGQITVPKEVRDHLGIVPGGAVTFEVNADGEVVLRKQHDTARPLRALLHSYAPLTAPTTEEIDAGIARAVAKLHAAAGEPGAQDG